jgi:hypothetical protein
MKETKFIFTLMLGCSLAAMAKADTSKDNCERVAGEGNCVQIGTSDTYYALSGAANNQTMTIYGTTGDGSAASVPEEAFYKSWKSTFPGGVTSLKTSGSVNIGYNAFKGATGLTSVDLTGVQTIGSGAFKNTGLTSLVLPDSFFDESGNMKNSISESALNGSGITNIYCPEGANCQNYFTTCPENTVDLGDCFDMPTFETVDRVPVTLNITPYTVENGQIKVGNRTYASLNDLANNNHIKKRIYTLKEANEVAGKVNHVSIKYR